MLLISKISAQNLNSGLLQIVTGDSLQTNFEISAQENLVKEKIGALCEEVDKKYAELGWNESGCRQIAWSAPYMSSLKNPLIYAEFGKNKKNTTLILSSVHPNEITPIYMGFKFALTLLKAELNESRVIIAPLVNPDGFFKKNPLRQNSNGVDLNRNFFTSDWYSLAKNWWSDRRAKSPGHFPGLIPNSEIETLFQVYLIEKFNPQKIISIHAPLGFYDYDGPGTKLNRSLSESEQRAKKIVHSMAKSAKNYRVVEYSFYPGSLGNYAGIERGIPTVTLELESIEAKKAEDYWLKFSPSLMQAVQFKIDDTIKPVIKSQYFTRAEGDK